MSPLSGSSLSSSKIGESYMYSAIFNSIRTIHKDNDISQHHLLCQRNISPTPAPPSPASTQNLQEHTSQALLQRNQKLPTQQLSKSLTPSNQTTLVSTSL